MNFVIPGAQALRGNFSLPVAFSDVTGLFFLVLRVALALFACRTAMKFSYFREITALIHTFLSYHCQQFFLLPGNYRTLPQFFSPTTANNTEISKIGRQS